MSHYNFWTLLMEYILENVATDNDYWYPEGHTLSGNSSLKRQDLRVVINDRSTLAKRKHHLGINWVGRQELTFRGFNDMMRNSEIIL